MSWSLGKVIALVAAVVALVALFVPGMLELQLAFVLIAAVAFTVVLL